MKSLLKLLFFLVLIFVVVPVLVLGYLGAIPGLSKVFGSDSPRDLGVVYSKMNADSFDARSGMTRETLPEGASPTESIRYEGRQDLNTSITSEEASALVKVRAEAWKYFPVSSAQIKFGADGTTEVSGMTSQTRLLGYFTAIGYPTEMVQKAMEKVGVLKGEFPFYIKGAGSVTDNKLTMNISKIEVGRLPISGSIILANKSQLINLAEKRMGSIPGFFAKSVKVTDGRLYFEGTIPPKEIASPR